MAGFIQAIRMTSVAGRDELVAAALDASTADDPAAFPVVVIAGEQLARPAALQLPMACALASAGHAPRVALGGGQAAGSDVCVFDLARDEVVWSGRVGASLLALALDDTGETLGVLHRPDHVTPVLAVIELATGKRKDLARGELEWLCYAAGAFRTCQRAGRKHRLLGLRPDGSRDEPFELPGAPWDLVAAGEAPVVACGLGRTRALRVDLAQRTKTQFGGHATNSPYAVVRVALSRDGTTLARWCTEDPRLLVHARGKTRELGPLPVRTSRYREHDELETSPGFALVGDALVTYDGAALRRFALR